VYSFVAVSLNDRYPASMTDLPKPRKWPRSSLSSLVVEKSGESGMAILRVQTEVPSATMAQRRTCESSVLEERQQREQRPSCRTAPALARPPPQPPTQNNPRPSRPQQPPSCHPPSIAAQAALLRRSLVQLLFPAPRTSCHETSAPPTTLPHSKEPALRRRKDDHRSLLPHTKSRRSTLSLPHP